MARIIAVSYSVGLAHWRNIRSLNSFATNNFFWVSLILIGPRAGALLYVLLVLVLLFPLSADPLRGVPAERMALWPLSKVEVNALRVVSLWLNPLTWVFVVLIAVHFVTAGLWALLAGLFAIGFLSPHLLSSSRTRTWYLLPAPGGTAGVLFAKTLRDILTTLDFYLAASLSVVAVIARIAGFLPEEASWPITFLIVLALSSYAQCLFGLDGTAGLTRYRLLPLAGWQLLLVKGAAFLVVTIALTLPTAPVAGVTASLVALTVGHAPSVAEPRLQQRWRFSTGASIPNGIGQTLLLATATAGFVNAGWPVLAACFAGYCVSAWYYGRQWEKIDLCMSL